MVEWVCENVTEAFTKSDESISKSVIIDSELNCSGKTSPFTSAIVKLEILSKDVA